MNGTEQIHEPESGLRSPDASLRDVFDVIASTLSSASFNVRENTLKELTGVVGEFIDDVEEKNNIFPFLVQILITSSMRWTDSESRKLLDSTLLTLANTHGSKFVLPFLQMYNTQIVKTFTKVTTVMERWLKWVSIVLTNCKPEFVCEGVDGAATLYTDLAKTIVHLMDTIYKRITPQAERRVVLTLAHIITASPALAAEYVKVVKGMKSFTVVYTKILPFVKAANYAITNPELTEKARIMWKSIRVVFLKQYADEIANSTTAPNAKVIEIFKYIGPFITEEDLVVDTSVAILPHIVRSLRRAPQLMLAPLTEFITSFQAGLLNAHLKDILPPMINELKHATDATRRVNGKSTLLAVLQCVTTEEAQKEIFAILANHLLGTNGVTLITLLDTKLVFIDCIAEGIKILTTKPTTSTGATNTTDSTGVVPMEYVQIILDVYNREALGTTKDYILSKLCSIYSTTPYSIPTSILDLVCTNIKAIDTKASTLTNTLTLSSFCTMFHNKAIPADVYTHLESHNMLDVFVTLMEYCITHPTAYTSGIYIYTLILLYCINKTDTTPGSTANLPSVISQVIRAPFYTVDDAFVSTLDTADASQLVAVYEILFKYYYTCISLVFDEYTSSYLGDMTSIPASVLSFYTTFVNFFLTPSLRKQVVPFFLQYMNNTYAHHVTTGILYGISTLLDAKEAYLKENPLPPIIDDAEPVYVAAWDGNDTFLSIKRYTTSKAKDQRTSNVLTSTYNSTIESIIFGQLLSTCIRNVDTKLYPFAGLLAAHPMTVSQDNDIYSTLQLMVNTGMKYNVDYVNVFTTQPNTILYTLEALFNTQSGWLVHHTSVYKNRGALNFLAYLAMTVPALFTDNVLPRLLATVTNTADIFALTPYEVAVYVTPAWKLCDAVDPDEEVFQPTTTSNNIRVDKNSTYSKAELLEMQKKKEQEEKERFLAKQTEQRRAKQAAIRVKLQNIIVPIINSMTALNVLCSVAPGIIHDQVLAVLTPVLHQYILGLPLPGTRAGYTATCRADFPVQNPLDTTPVQPVIPVLRGNSVEVLKCLAKTLDSHIIQDNIQIYVAADMLSHVWEYPSEDLFDLLDKAVVGKDTAALRASATNDHVHTFIALTKALEYVVEQVEDIAPLSAPSFTYILPTLDAVLKYAPDVTNLLNDDDDDDEEELDGEDEKDAAADANDETNDDVHVSDENFKQTLIETVSHAVLYAAKLVSLHCSPASQSSNGYPVYNLIQLVLVSLDRLKNREIIDMLQDGFMRLASGLNLDQIKILNSNQGIFANNVNVRIAVLQGLSKCSYISQLVYNNNRANNAEYVISDEDTVLLQTLTTNVYTLKHDHDKTVANLASMLFEKYGLLSILNTTPVETLVDNEVQLLTHTSSNVRDATCGAIAAILDANKTEHTVLYLLDKLTVVYSENKDYVIKKQSSREKDTPVDMGPYRISVLHCIRAILSCIILNKDILRKYLTFLIETVFGETNRAVWKQGYDVLTTFIHKYGEQFYADVSGILKQYINNPQYTNNVKQGTSLGLGVLSHYIKDSSNTSTEIFTTLLQALESPSQETQRSVAKELMILTKRMPDYPAASQGKHTPFFDNIIARLTDATKDSNPNVRKGAAYGLAAILSSLSGTSLTLYNIFNTFKDQLGSRNGKEVHGALCVFEALYVTLGQVLVPYITSLVQVILPCYANIDRMVRIQAEITISAITSQLSSTGIQVLLPILLSGLKDKAWRTKVESIQMLASLTKLPPKELSICVPLAIARLLDAVTDANEKVSNAANAAIIHINTSMRNPELRKNRHLIVDCLLSRTTEATRNVITMLHTTVFQHCFDPISLALIVPILRGALKEPDNQIRKQSIQIIGALPVLVRAVEDLEAYVDGITRQLRGLLMDSIPDIRQTSAKAIGNMANGVLAPHFTDLLQLLLDVLLQKEVKIPANSDQNIWASYGTSSAQRSGSALGSAQLLLGQGLERTEDVLDNVIVPALGSDREQVREGMIMLLHSLPEAYGVAYGPLLVKTFPLIIGCLCDAYAVCRELAVKAGQQLVINFAQTQSEVIFASIMEALLDDDYRVRQGSLQLAANFTLRLAGQSGDIVFADIDDANSHVPGQSIREHTAINSEAEESLVVDKIGLTNRNDLMTSIYLLRSDVSEQVSNIAWRVWKAIVPSTGRMLQTILPSLIERITADLASWNPTRQQTAANALNELVNKLGDRILRDIVPLLLDKLTSSDIHTRKGVCLGLAEISAAATKSMMSNYLADFIPAMADALCDINVDVRASAKTAYQALVQTCGERVVRETIPILLESIDTRHTQYKTLIAKLTSQGVDAAEIAEERDSSDDAIDGLRLALTVFVHDRVALELVINHLLAAPITTHHISVLSKVSGTCSKTFLSYLNTVVLSLFSALYATYRDLASYAEEETERIAESVSEQTNILASATQVFAGLDPQVAQPRVLESLLQNIRQCEYQSTLSYIASIHLSVAFWRASKVDDESIMLNDCLSLYFDMFDNNDDERVVLIAAQCLDALFKSFHSDVMIKYIAYIRSKFNDLTGKKKKSGVREVSEIAGLGNTDLIQTMTTFLQHGLITGTPNIRIQASAGISDVCELAPATALASVAMKLTGFLIRTFGDRLAVEVRAHILSALGYLMKKNATQLKAFQSQLKSSMIRALSDESPIIITRSATALITIQNPHTYVMDIFHAVDKHTSSDTGSKLLHCIRNVYNESGNDALLAQKETHMDMIDKLLSYLLSVDVHATLRVESAKLLAMLLNHVDTEFVSETISRLLSDAGIGSSHAPHWVTRQSVAMVFSSILLYAKDLFLEHVGYKPAIAFIARGFKDDNEDACTATLRFAGRVLIFAADNDDDQIVKMLTQELLSLAQPGRVAESIGLCALEQVRKFGEACSQYLNDNMNIVVALCIRARTGAGKLFRKEIDTILYYTLGFHDSYEEGMECAEGIAEKLNEAEANEFLALCKRSVAKIMD